MAFTRQYDLVRFDATTATLYINLFTNEVGNTTQIITADSEVPVVLPVDSEGNVPVGNALTTFLNRYVINITPDKMLQSKLELIRFGNQVHNANAMYNLTDDVEDSEVDQFSPPADSLWIPVVIFPDRTYTPSGDVFTRSVIAPVGGNFGDPIIQEVFPSNFQDRVGLSQYQLFKQYVTGGILKLVHHSKSNGVSQQAVITTSISDLQAPTYIVRSYPFIYNQDNIDGIISDGADISDYQHFFYLEHEPLSISVSYARAWFVYNI